MTTEVTIPLWVLVAVWSVVGRAVALRLQALVLTNSFVGRPSWLFRLPLAVRYALLTIAVVITGPLVWCAVAREAGKDIGERIGRRVSRWWLARRAGS